MTAYRGLFLDSDSRPLTSVPLSALDRSPAPPLLLDRLDAQESTILFGPGGIGKGSLACWWIVQLTRLGKRVLILDYEDHGGEWARRVASLGGADALDSVQWTAPLKELRAAAIWDHAEPIRAHALTVEAEYLVVDSAAMACFGADPAESDAAIRYTTALQLIGLPSLTLAHVTKLHDARYPFGSVFWHNGARATASLMPKGEEVLLVSRKNNNHAKFPAQSVTMTWYRGTLGEVTERPAAWTLADRVADILEDGTLRTPTEIAAELNEGSEKADHTTPNTVSRTLSRSLGNKSPRHQFTVHDGRWTIRRP